MSLWGRMSPYFVPSFQVPISGAASSFPSLVGWRTKVETKGTGTRVPFPPLVSRRQQRYLGWDEQLHEHFVSLRSCCTTSSTSRMFYLVWTILLGVCSTQFVRSYYTSI